MLLKLFMLLSSGLSISGRRSNNEDAWLDAPNLKLFAVADGIGGYEGGEVAARLATATLAHFVMRHQRDPEGTWPKRELRTRSFEENLLAAAGEAAHREILARKKGALARMGSTLVATLFHGTRMTVMHCGDSRLYRLRDGRAQALTRDHSVWAEMAEAGIAGVRSNFVWKNQITRALGLEDHAVCDVATFEVARGDVFLLCSDGLYDCLEDERLARGMALPPFGACNDLLEAAYAAGSADNITAVVVRVE